MPRTVTIKSLPEAFAALLRVETLAQFSTPFLRFHPTLPYAARATEVPDPEESERRFIGVYLGVMLTVDEALGGGQPAAGMRLMSLEEANFRTAIRRAFRRGDRQAGQALANTLQRFLERAGRLRERDEAAAWVRQHMPAEGALDAANCAAIQQHAWSRLTQGYAAEAIATIENLIRRLEAESLADAADPAFQIAMGHSYLGRVLYHAGRPDRALGPIERAIDEFEGLGEAQRGSLSAALADLANALTDVGRLDNALEAAERALAIDRELESDRNVAAALARTAGILRAQGRYTEAEARYTEAHAAARAAGDLGLQGGCLQHQGGLHMLQGHHDRAVALYRQALKLFRHSGDTVGEIQTTDMLGSAEAERGKPNGEGRLRRQAQLNYGFSN